jgi:DNA-binding NtrC family response regulator
MNNAAVSILPGAPAYSPCENGAFPLPPQGSTCRTITPSAAMQGVLDLVARIAPTNSAVLICGESGVGKETLAREIHRKSGRAHRAFVRAACGAICQDHLDAELFGRDGYRLLNDPSRAASILARSNQGTLFLKDVCKLPFWAQVKLLDVLQQAEYQQPESNAGTPLDVRVIATTTCDLEAALAEGRFHAGLYYYLNIVEIRIPPLRERPEDIRPLAESFLARIDAAAGPGKGGVEHQLSAEAWQRLLQYDWPGNARELASVMAHAVAVADRREIGATGIAVSLSKARCQRDCEAISVPLLGGLKQIERSVIGAVIERCRGNKAKAARVLKLHRRTLYRLLQNEG